MKKGHDLFLLPDEKDRIVNFIQEYANGDEPVCVLVSGGLDSDVTARLCVNAIGNKRVHLVVVLQDEMEERHIHNAQQLAGDISVVIDKVDLRGMNLALIKAAEAGNSLLFDSGSLLDPNRAKCSLRTSLISCYQDKGFLIAGTSNRTEVELGFFLPFGDNFAHFKPIAHLYKTQVIQLAREIGCHPEVIKQPPSAGFWIGQEDLTDLAYWIINRAPIMGKGRKFTDEEDLQMNIIRSILTQEKVDSTLLGISHGYDAKTIAEQSNLPVEYIEALTNITKMSRIWKTRPLLKQLDIR
jgi:NAD+ synthase